MNACSSARRTAPRAFKLKRRPVNIGKTDFSRDHRWQSEYVSPPGLPLANLPGVAEDFPCDFMSHPQGFFDQICGDSESVGFGNRLL